MNKPSQGFLVESLEFGSTETTINGNDLSAVSQHRNRELLERYRVTSQSVLESSEKVPVKVITLEISS